MNDQSPTGEPLDELWRELYRADARRHVRLADRYGTCPCCNQPATDLIGWDGVCWARCSLCRTRWVAGVDIVDPYADERLNDIDAQEFGEVVASLAIQELAGFRILPVIVRNTKERIVDSPIDLDPRTLQGPREAPLLPASNRRERVSLASLIIRDLAANPPECNCAGQAIVAGCGAWDRLRFEPLDGGQASVNVEGLITRPGNHHGHLTRALEVLAPVAAAHRRAAQEQAAS
jgi:hypothetical protein